MLDSVPPPTAPQAAIHAISDGLDDMIVDESARIAIITFDDSMHFYDLGVSGSPCECCTSPSAGCTTACASPHTPV